MLAQPHRNALLRLFLLITRETPARLSAAVLEKPLDAFVTSAGHAKVTRVDRSREVEAMILLVPMPRSALDDLDGLAWLGKLPPHRASIPKDTGERAEGTGRTLQLVSVAADGENQFIGAFIGWELSTVLPPL